MESAVIQIHLFDYYCTHEISNTSVDVEEANDLNILKVIFNLKSKQLKMSFIKLLKNKMIFSKLLVPKN